MARQNISTGSAANDGTGDTLRQAAQKINETFVEIYQKFGGDSDILSPVVSFDNTGIKINLGNSYTLTAAGIPAADRTVFLPDANGTAILDTATQTLTNKTLTTPTISSPKITTAINDTNANELVKFTSTASAVNEITIINAASGNDPVIKASGEANRNLHLKGNSTTGAVILERLALDTVDQGSSSTLLITAAHTFLSGTTPVSVGVPDGTIDGQLITVSNRKGSNVNLTPTSSNIAGVTTQITLNDNETVMLLWDGSSEWFVMGGNGYAIS